MRCRCSRALRVCRAGFFSPQLFALQSESYRGHALSEADKMDSMIVTTQARWLMHDWLFNKVAEEYALAPDWDDRWRTDANAWRASRARSRRPPAAFADYTDCRINLTARDGLLIPFCTRGV